ncbi:MAG: amino acid adenylation domain-containing protein [Ktedonobacteraceae bacterium]
MTDQLQGFELSYQQKRLWLLQFSDASQAYRCLCAIALQGNLFVEVLRKAVQDVISCHEVLRTVFRQLPGVNGWVQCITNDNMYRWSKRDLSHYSPLQQEARIDEFFQEEKERPFDLEQGPPLHIHLFTISEEQSILFVSLPALCSDARTMKNLISDLSRAYAANITNTDFFNEPVQYAQFSGWQQEMQGEEDAKAGKDYWSQQNRSALSVAKLPFKCLPSYHAPFEYDSLQFMVDSHIFAEVTRLASKYQTSIATFLLACWQVLLYRLSAEPYIGIGYVLDGRKYEELDDALGIFAQSVPIYARLEADVSYRDFLRQIDRLVCKAYDYQEYFIGETRSTAKVPYFDVSFEFDEQVPLGSVAGLLFSMKRQYACIDRFKIKLLCKASETSLFAELCYEKNLFQYESMLHLAEKFQELLSSICHSPEAPLNALSIMSNSERENLLVGLNQTQTDYPSQMCFHHLFEAQVVRTPDSIAVVCEDSCFTYQELNTRANQLSHYLISLGVGPEVSVGISLEGLWLMIGLFGVLKAGGAYVPLGSEQSQKRRAFILADSQCSVLLVQEESARDHLETDVIKVALDTSWERITQASRDNPINQVTPENLSYILYTSGSTGKPKGVMVPHRGLVNYLYWCIHEYAIAEGQGTITYSSISFDFPITSLFAPLLAGRQVRLIPENGGTQSLEALGEALNTKEYFSLIKITPTHLEALGQMIAPAQVNKQTRLLIIGGENLSSEKLSPWRTLAPSIKMVNEYGPTEAVVGCCTYMISADTRETGAVPIGRPINNTRLYILDSRLEPVPTNVPGELYIGGEGVTRGYLGRPDLTAEMFIPNPFSQEQGTRLYRTGDLACYLSDGNIEFLGRMDHQVKIHGYRVEPGEVEIALCEHPSVRQAVVVERENHLGSKSLIAYVVLDQKQASVIPLDSLANFLKESVPDYMIPAHFLQLDTLPLTPSGKVDRKALRESHTTYLGRRVSYAAPATPKEKVLVKIWTQTLGIEQLGILDDFFALGGDSILSIQVVARANRAGLHITPKQLFQLRTVAALAEAAVPVSAAKAEQKPMTGSVPLSPIQRWFFEQDFPNPHHWNLATLLDARQPLISSLLEKSLWQLLLHHDALQFRFIHGETGWQQTDGTPDVVLPFTHIDLSALSEKDLRRTIEVIANEVQASLNLFKGPLLRSVFFDLGKHNFGQLLLVVHHLVIDGLSWRILLEDLQTAYRLLGQAEGVTLGAKTSSYRLWTYRLSEYARSHTLRQEHRYWNTLREASPPHLLPTDYPRDGRRNDEASACVVTEVLSSEETQALIQRVSEVYHTQIDDLLLTALVQTFVSWTGVPRLLLDLEGHGRDLFDNIDLSRTVGWFTSLFPVLLDLEGIATLEEAIKSIKEQLRHIPSRGVGYGLLRYLGEDKDDVEQLLVLPAREVNFNYLGQFDQTLPADALFAFANESSGISRSACNIRTHLLEIIGSVVGNQLQLSWVYSSNFHSHATIEKLAMKFVENIRSIIHHCLSSPIGSYTPSDFPAAKVSQEVLDKIITKLNEAKG